MSRIPDHFKGFRIHNDGPGHHAGVEAQQLDQLSAGDLVLGVEWSSVNYKDALAGTAKGKILRQFPLNGGIDLAGEVIQSESDRFQPGDKVIVTGCGLSETRDGGYSEIARVDSADAVPLPAGLTTREAMILGTAGFTAALSLHRMEANGQTPAAGPIVVTGATGGVGSIAINLLTRAGYEVHAISGKTVDFDWLEELGARQCISRHDLHWGQNALEKAIWAGCIDNVGGDMLAGISRVINLWGNIACCGMAGGHALHTTVFPMILRGVSLLGISSANCPYELRVSLWDRLANEWKPALLDKIQTLETDLSGLPEVFETMISGGSRGRSIVRLQ
ncbi:MAG: YhdH/YhfP family quinone oxidoreductase [Xanthomonadales bacterium]|nr:YhdH/YhfP family quinone oxidoreductase [Xanthomonadales bacterium]